MSHWDAYWSEGNITSFSADFSKNYEGEYSTYWTNVFLELKEQSTVLDLATGNLALPLLGLNAREHGIEFYAVDLSVISKELLKKRNPDYEHFIERIHLFDRTNIEDLPFSDGKFDLISSMYGFEYADLRISLEEIARVLKPGGWFRAVCHCESSVIIEKNRKTYRYLKQLLYKAPVLDTIFELSKLIGNKTGPMELSSLKYNKKAEKHRKKINEILSSLERQFGDDYWESGIPRFVAMFFKGLPGSVQKDREQAIKKKKAEMKLHLERLNDLLRASLDENKVSRIFSSCDELGLKSPEISEFRKGGEVVGLLIEIQK